jgi:hypothetical protein
MKYYQIEEHKSSSLTAIKIADSLYISHLKDGSFELPVTLDNLLAL